MPRCAAAACQRDARRQQRAVRARLCLLRVRARSPRQQRVAMRARQRGATRTMLRAALRRYSARHFPVIFELYRLFYCLIIHAVDFLRYDFLRYFAAAAAMMMITPRRQLPLTPLRRHAISMPPFISAEDAIDAAARRYFRLPPPATPCAIFRHDAVCHICRRDGENDEFHGIFSQATLFALIAPVASIRFHPLSSTAVAASSVYIGDAF